MLLLLFACLALHPIHDLHLHAVDIQKQASAIVANQDQHYFWLTETDINEVLHEYCLTHNGQIKNISDDTTNVLTSSPSEDSSIDVTKQKKEDPSTSSDETNSGRDSKPSPQTIYQDDILTQSAYLCITTPSSKSFETNQALHKEKNEHDSEEGFGETSEDTNVVNNSQRQDQRIEYDDRSYLRIHSVGKDRKRVHIVSVANDDVHAYPMSTKTIKDPLLDTMLRERERMRIFDYRYIGNPSKLTDLAPLPFGYEITDQTETGITLERLYIERIDDINPKIAVFKRIEVIDIQLRPNIQFSQTTTHIFRSDIYGRQVEEIKFQDLRNLQLWLIEIMIQHASLFSNEVEHETNGSETNGSEINENDVDEKDNSNTQQ